ncbi:MAG: glycosyltransferase family 2 protein [bacterium]|nr:glycosyltransferase family 2 protein [bacterium]
MKSPVKVAFNNKNSICPVKVSIITVSFNSKDFINHAIESVLSQTYKNIEYIIIDGGSTDDTIDIIKEYKDKITKFVSEPDNGIYDAMNKGLKMATGDIIGILNSDDFYADNSVIETVVKNIKNKNADACWGDLFYIDKENISKIVRNWKSSKYSKNNFGKGWMPAHPTFFVKRWVYEKYGYFNLDFPISADYEIMLRFLERYKIKSCYIQKVLVKMRTGGNSNKNMKNIIRANIECYNAWKVNGLRANPIIFIIKPLLKVFQYPFFKRSI